MSTPNPTHIDVGAMALLDALRNDETNWIGQRQWDPATARLHFEHVVSKLTDAGYSIVPNLVLTELVDPDKCSFDHNGGCQAHGHFPPDDQAWTCPVGDAKNILTAATEGDSRG